MDVLWRPFITLLDGSRRCLADRHIERRRPDEKMVTMMAKSAIDLGRPEIAIDAVQDLDKYGIPFTVFTVSVLIKAHGRQASSAGVTKVLEGLEGRGIEPDLIVFNTAIDAYVRCGEREKAGHMLREVTRRGLTPNATSYNPILRDIAQSGKLEEAMALRHDMERRHIKPSAYTYNALIQTAVTAKKWTLATEYLIQSSAAAQKARRYGAESGQGVGGGHKSDDLQPSTMSKDVAVGFTTVISGLAMDGDIKRAGQLLDHMVKRIEESGRTNKLELEIGIGATAILSALLSRDDVVRAWKLFRSIRRRFNIRLPPDAYNAMIRGLTRRGDSAAMEAGERVFSEMMKVFRQQRTVSNALEMHSVHASPSQTVTEVTSEDITLAYNTMIDGYSRAGNTAAGEQLLEEMEANGYVTTVVTYTTLMNGYGKEMDIESTRRVFKRMRERGISADRVTMNAFVGGCVRVGDMDLAVRLFEEMQRIGGRVSPNLVTFSAMIAGYVRQNRRSDAWDTYEEMKGLGIAPNERLLDRMMAAFVSPELKPARETVEEGEEVDQVVEWVEAGGDGGLLDGDVRDGLLSTDGWASKIAMVLLQDMETCRCSEINKVRWRRAISSLWNDV